jgi:bifunctional non-homologous end joining protein LigD
MSTRTTRVLPTVQPIVPVIGSPPLKDPAWVYEPKFDGFRGVLYVSQGKAYFRSKNGSVLRRFAELAERVRVHLPVREAILDGEIVALDDEGRQDFRALLGGGSHGWLHYAAFDLLWSGARDLSRHSLTVRKRQLEDIIPETNPSLSRMLVVEGDGRDLFEAVQRLDLEGIIAKRKADSYSSRAVWYKIKNPSYTQLEGRGELFQRRASPGVRNLPELVSRTSHR